MSQGIEAQTPRSALTRGGVATHTHPNGYVERLTVRASRVERACQMCGASIAAGELCGVQRPGLFNYRVCWRCCVPVPEAVVARQRAERAALYAVHEDALYQQLVGLAEGGSIRGIRPQFDLDRWRWDFLIYGPRGAPLLIDIQGGLKRANRGRHGSPEGYANDCRKWAEATLRGFRYTVVTGEMVQSGEALRLVECILAAPAEMRDA